MADESKTPDTLQFHYIKSPNYREIACHGVIGNPNPSGKIWVAFYAERSPIPRVVEYSMPSVTEGQTTVQFNEVTAGAPISIESRRGVIRHVEFTAYLDLEVAERLQKWLGDRIAQIRETQK
jgi:hypothetical protein